MARRCVFCGDAGVTLEHIWPQWLRQLPGPSKMMGLTLVPREITSSRTIRASTFGFPITVQEKRGDRNPAPYDLRVKMVCGACNSGWMSALEAQVKPILFRLVESESSELSRKEQAVLARWCIKTTMLYTLWFGDESPYTREDFRRLYRENQFPKSTVAYVGRATSAMSVMAMDWDAMKGAVAPGDREGNDEMWDSIPVGPTVRARIYLAASGVVFLVHFDALSAIHSIRLPQHLAAHWLELAPHRRSVGRVPLPMTDAELDASVYALTDMIETDAWGYAVVIPEGPRNDGGLENLLTHFRNSESQ